jgi:predicted metal-binding protein
MKIGPLKSDRFLGLLTFKVDAMAAIFSKGCGLLGSSEVVGFTSCGGYTGKKVYRAKMMVERSTEVVGTKLGWTIEA